MYECCEDPSHICEFATELLFDIFKLLPAKDLTNCRLVNRRWRDVVDALYDNNQLWKKHCIEDFQSTYEVAKKKSCLSWAETYRSLTLWGRVSTATETIDEFCHSPSSVDEIRDCYFLNNRILLVHKRTYIAFYDITTMEMTDRNIIPGEFMTFIECDDVVVTHNSHLHLNIVYKPHDLEHSGQQRPQDQRFVGIKLFVIVNRDVYYVSLTNRLFHTNIDTKQHMELDMPPSEFIVTLSNHNNIFHILTTERYIYALLKGDFVKVFFLDDTRNIFDSIYRFNLFEQMEWYVLYMWAAHMKTVIPPGPLQRISVIKVYGDTIFVGSNNGSLLIYYKPFINGEFNLFNAEPVREYNFVERRDIPVLSQQPVISVEVLETLDGHKVLVSMPRKIIVITFTHNFECPMSNAVFPYEEAGRPLAVIP